MQSITIHPVFAQRFRTASVREYLKVSVNSMKISGKFEENYNKKIIAIENKGDLAYG